MNGGPTPLPSLPPTPLSPESYPKLESIWESGESFLAYHAVEEKRPGRFFHPASGDPELPAEGVPGALLSVIIRFRDRNAEFHMHGRVLERRTAGERPGLLIEFLEEEREREALVVAFARGESVPYFRRRWERISCNLYVLVHTGWGKRVDALAVDISEGGVYLVPIHELRVEDMVTLSVTFPGRKRIAMAGRVASVIPDGPQQGTGIEFLFESKKQRDDLVEQVALLRTKRR